MQLASFLALDRSALSRLLLNFLLGINIEKAIIKLFRKCEKSLMTSTNDELCRLKNVQELHVLLK